MMDDELEHYGTPRHSGRYPWGSGENPQRSKSWRQRELEYKKQGMTEKQRAEANGLKIDEYRAKLALEQKRDWLRNSNTANTLRNKGMSLPAIAERMHTPVSTVVSYLDPSRKERMLSMHSTAEALKRAVKEKGFIDTSAGIEHQLGVTQDALKKSVNILKMEGYTVQTVPIQQVGTGKYTNVRVLAPPGTTTKEVWQNRHNIKMIDETSEDGGKTFEKRPIKNISSKRVAIRYAEDGGTDMDGVIELRRGVKDLDLGKARYAQVRIGVDGTHYLKGMAIYADDLPDGVDIRFNTNKDKSHSKLDCLKPQKDDPENPFGASIKEGPAGRKGYLNIIREEGDWTEWSRNLASQFLSKQDTSLAKRQLDKSLMAKQDEYDDIMQLTNPIVKKHLLYSFGDDCDSAAVHLKAASLPRQTTSVLLPLKSIKPGEVYAPNYENGEEIVLVRYPHGGTFEIPRLIVNNKNKDAKRLFENAKDAVGIHPTTAAQLSGADFDGDTAIVIPTKGLKIKTKAPLEGLINFDPKAEFPGVEGMASMGKKGGHKEQTEMGMISNLINDMTLKGATDEELTRAVKHSMVVIDAAKHNLNYKLSEEVNGISQLKKDYQGGGGVSTLLSRAKSEVTVPHRSTKYYINEQTGEKIFKEKPEQYVKKVKQKDGSIKEVLTDRLTKSTKMYEATDARELSSGLPMEEVYASYANSLKSLGNSSRKEYVAIKPQKVNKAATLKYAPQVDSLMNKLAIAEKNAPYERQAQAIANAKWAAMVKDNPELKDDKDYKKKKKNQLLVSAREQVGAKKQRVTFTDEEVEAINAGAISTNRLEKLLQHADADQLKAAFTPRSNKGMTADKIAKAKMRLNRGYTNEEVAKSLGISVSTLLKYV